MKNRFGIFCYFSPIGQMETDIIDTLKDLRKVLSYLIVVINGEVIDISGIKTIADQILFRKNCGYDAGAYKEVIFNPIFRKMIEESDELVLCNSSFYGPFVSFSEIFKKMDLRSKDFWGLSSVERNLAQHIQSYFLVYERRIIVDKVLWEYFDKYIDDNTNDYVEVCNQFENGLFHYLTDRGYTFDAYVRKIKCYPYTNPYGSLALDGLPLLKKKVFTDQYYQAEQVIAALAFIKQKYHYDISRIIANIRERYGVDLEKTDYAGYNLPLAEADVIDTEKLIELHRVREFFLVHRKIYIYGAGDYGGGIYNLISPDIREQKLCGFIISDDQESKKEYFKYPVFVQSAICDEYDAGIVVALSKKNTQEVKANLGKRDNILYLWEETE